MKKSIYYSLVISLFVVVACHYEPVEQPTTTINNGGNNGTNNGNNNSGTNTTPMLKPCNADTTYFKNDVLPIFVSNCAKSGCHDALTKVKGIQTTDYQSIMQNIKPYNLSDSKHYKYMAKKDVDKIMPPPPNAPLNATQLQIVAKWILQGAKNNECDANASGCNTQNVKYSTFVKPLLDKNCNGCHGAVSPSANISLTEHTNVQKQAKSGALYGSISHNANYSKMPKGGAKLDACDLNKIKAWIDAGALNN
jgi:Cytochrome C oxidase, cbb3-type, subunit III